MELTHTARVRVPLERAWVVAGDPTLLASALAGAELEATDGLACHGTLTVKIGPITARYGGTVVLTWRDDHAHRMVLDVVGDEIDGVGRAEATINATFRAEGAGATVVGLVSTLTMTGRAGQFGQALLADVGQGLLTDLVAALEQGALADDVVLDELAELHLEWDRGDEQEDRSSEPVDDEEEESAGANEARERRRDRRRRRREEREQAATEAAAARAAAAAEAAAASATAVIDAAAERPAVRRPRPLRAPEPEAAPARTASWSTPKVDAAAPPADDARVEPPETVKDLDVDVDVAAVTPEPELVVPEPEPTPIVPEPEPEPIVPQPEPEPIVPEPEPEVPQPEPAPIVPEPEPQPIVPPPTPEPEPRIVPPTPSEPEVLPEPEPPTATPHPELQPVDVISPQRAAPQPSPLERAAPFVLFLALLWLLRRRFGSSDD